MKILLINYRYFVSGGPERYMFNLKALLERKGHSVVPFSIRYTKNIPTVYDKYFVSPLSDENEVYFKEQSWSFQSVKKSLERVFYSKEVYENLANLIEEEKPDYAIVLHYLRKLSPAVLHVLQRKKIPFVVRISDFALICPQAHLFRDKQVCESCITNGMFESVRHGCVQNSRSISLLNYISLLFQYRLGFYRDIPSLVIPSSFTLRKYREAGWPAERMVHLPTFVTHVEVAPRQDKIRQIVYVGRVEYLKGIHILLEALAYLKGAKNIEIPAKIIGNADTDYFEIHQRFCIKKDLRFVEFVPFMERTELFTELGRSYVSAAPSIWYDNMPNSVLESLSLGTPVIASNHGSLPELVQEGVNGYLFTPGDYIELASKIQKIFDENEKYFELCQNSINGIREKHSAEKHYDLLIGLYEKQKKAASPKPGSTKTKAADKRILLVNTYHYLRGGDCTYTFALRDIIKRHGHTVIDFAMRHPLNVKSEYEDYFAEYIDFREMNASKKIRDGFRVINRSIFSAHAKKRISKLLDEHPPRVAHLQNFHGHLTPSVLVELKKRRIPILMTLHDYKFICPNTHFLSHGVICEACKGGRFYQCTVRACKKESRLASMVASLEAYTHAFMDAPGYINHFISPSEFLRGKFIEFGYKPERISVLNNFLVPSQFDDTPHPVDDYLLFVGQIETWKGIQTLIECGKRLPKHLHIKFAGTGQMLGHFQSISEHSDNIEFCGYLNQDALKRLIKCAYFIIQPSAWYENYPYSIMEAMALGKPVIATRVGGLPELVHHGENGFLFPPGDSMALTEIIADLPGKDTAEYRRLCKNSYDLAREKFDAEAYFARIDKIYEQLMEK